MTAVIPAQAGIQKTGWRRYTWMIRFALTLRADLQSFNALRAFVRHAPE
jgi:hypothetical protein